MPVLVEIVGPAGAGKSTLAQALARKLGAPESLSVWGQRRRDLAGGAVRALPAALAAAAGGRPLAFSELTQMARVAAMRRTVRRAAAGESLVILDEGPVFALAWFDAFYGRNGDPGWASWRRRAIADWSQRLDLIVRLDAGGDRLIGRIRGRDKNHRAKDWPDRAIDAFQGRYRAAYDKVIAELRAAGKVHVIELRSDELSPDALAGELAGRMMEYLNGC
jgi:thymidylate kinase